MSNKIRLFFVVAALILGGQGQAFGNLINNPGLDDTDERGKLIGWTSSVEGNESETITIDKADKYSGTGALRITQQEQTTFSSISQKVPVKKNTKYTISGYAKVSGISAKGAGPRIYVTDGNSKVELAYIDITSLSWEQVSVTFDSKDYDSILLRCYFHLASGTVWFDELSLEPGEETKQETSFVPVSGASTNPIKNPGFDNVDEHGKPIGWMSTVEGNESETVAIDKADKYSGTGALRITQQEQTSLSSIFQKVPVKKNTKYTISGFAKVSGISAKGAGPRIYVTDGNSKVELAYIDITSLSWEQVSVTFDSKDYDSILLRCYFHLASGTVWFDELNLMEGVKTAQSGKKTENLKLIKNGSFEEQLFRGWEIESKGIGYTVSDKKYSEGEKSLFLKGKGSITLATPKILFDFLDEYDKYALSFDYLPVSLSGKEELKLKFDYYDAFGKLIDVKSATLTISKSDTFQKFLKNISFPANLMESQLRIEAIFPSSAEMYLDNIVLTKEEGSKLGSSWIAEWIRPESKDAVTGTIYYRKAFFLEQEPKEANLIITADDVISNIYINGAMLSKGRKFLELFLIDKYEISKYLTKGKNVLAVEIFNKATQGGLLCECNIDLKDGKNTFIKSDSTFKSTTNFSKGWETVIFDDANWSGQYSYGSPPSAQPWGHMSHPYLAVGKTNVEILDISFPEQVTAEKENLFRIKFIPEDETFDFNIKVSCGDYSFMLLKKKLQKLRINKENVFSTNIVIPAYIAQLGDSRIEIESERSSMFSKKEMTIEQGKIVLPIEIRFDSKYKYANDMADAGVVIKKGQIPTLSINGSEWQTTHHMTGRKYTLREENLGTCRDNNIHLYWGGIGHDWGWIGEGQYDFSKIDEFCLRLLEIDPQAYFILQFVVDSFFCTQMLPWNLKYPEELVQDYTGNTHFLIHGDTTRGAPSWASKRWLSDQKNNLKAIVDHVKNSPYSQRVIGFTADSGLGVEWVYWGAHHHIYVDYSKPFTKAFQDWLQEKYQTIARLNAIYKRNFENFPEVTLPSKEERAEANYYLFIDPEKNQWLIDFRKFFSEVTSNAILSLARVIKESSGGKAIFGTYYGYIMYPVMNWSECGHFALGKMLRSKDIDFLTSIIPYVNRLPGQESGFMTPVDSYKLHGKYSVIQLDIRTHLVDKHSPEAAFGRCNNVKESVAVIERDFANCLVSGAAFEIGYGGRGWETQDKRIMEVVGKCSQIEKDMQSIPRKTMDKETSIALIVDDVSTYYTPNDPDTNWMVNWMLTFEQARELYHSGTGFDSFLLEDLPIMPDYKCYIFLNTFAITEEQKAFIDRNLKKDNKTLVWIYAPGIIDTQKLDPMRIQAITDIKMTIREESTKPTVEITDTENTITSYMKIGDNYSYQGKRLGPVFIPVEGNVLGKLKGDGEPALVVKKFSNWTSIYSYSPNLPASLIRGIAKYAGVHIANYERSDATYLSDRLLAIHTVSEGKRKLYAPSAYKTKATELFRDREYPIRNGFFEVDVEPLSTYLFLFE